MRVLLTNDDGLHAEGLQTMRRALLEIPGVELAVIAPAENQSATARSITTRRPIWVEEVPYDDGSVGYTTDGTPVDCVRFAALGLIEGFEADLIVSGINHGSNLGDDITYSGTVACAFEGVLLGIPGVAVSQEWVAGKALDFTTAAAFAARVVQEIESSPLPPDTILNINCPAGEARGVEVAPLGKRKYTDELKVHEHDGSRRLFQIYGEPQAHEQEGTDLAAVADGRIAVTPLHFDLNDEPGLETLRARDLARLLEPAAREVE
jgi:5'-nucleotidase